MDLLYKNLEGKVKFVTKKVENFAEVEDKVIVNCTGNGAKELAKDEKMVSVQGHLIMLENQEPKDINHMILVYFGKNKTKSGFDVKRSFYIFPKRTLGSNARDVGVIGGTFIEGATASTPNEEEFDIMLQGAKDFYGIK
jgi:glycine/D-amino acid oxidase-like deaminating enzyme